MVTIRIATTDVAISMQIWRLKSYRIHVCIMRTCYPRFVVTDFNFIPYAPCGFLVINGYYSVPLSVSGIFILSNYRHGVIGLSPSCRTITLQRSAALYVSNTHGISHLIPPKQKRRIVATNVKYTFGPFFASNYQTNFLLAFFVGAKCTTNLILTSKYFALLETKTPVRLPIPV